MSDRAFMNLFAAALCLAMLFVYALHRSEAMHTQLCLEAIKAKDAKAVELTCKR